MFLGQPLVHGSNGLQRFCISASSRLISTSKGSTWSHKRRHNVNKRFRGPAAKLEPARLRGISLTTDTHSLQRDAETNQALPLQGLLHSRQGQRTAGTAQRINCTAPGPSALQAGTKNCRYGSKIQRTHQRNAI